jgi:hypothetical protein
VRKPRSNRDPPRILIRILLRIAKDLVSFMLCRFRSHAQLAGENLFLRKQLALFLERQMKPHRADDATRITLVGTDCRRAPREAWNSGLSANREAVHACQGTAREYRHAGVEHVHRNHARSVLACDFFVAATSTFRMIYVFVGVGSRTRGILHWNVTAHPTADWTAQQFRMIVAGDQPHRFVIHDRDTIYSEGVDATLAAMGLAVLKTPVRVPQANAF